MGAAHSGTPTAVFSTNPTEAASDEPTLSFAPSPSPSALHSVTPTAMLSTNPTEAVSNEPTTAPTLFNSPTAPSNPPVAPPTDPTEVIKIDLFQLEFSFAPKFVCTVAEVLGRVTGTTSHACARACAVLAHCDGFEQFLEGEDNVPSICVLSWGDATQDCDESSANALYYAR